ncbi:MAG TPA: ATP-binding protein [Steroidobacteraceae bacterium]|nr:ATP-binding protein [Steroidobacteraceae bacterium]
MRELAHRWVFGGVAIVYAALMFALLPWAAQPGYDTPFLIGIYGVAICLADVCTVLFLLRQYRRDGEAWLLVLSAAYLLSAFLVLPVSLSFPGAFGTGQYFGHETTSAILFLSWRLGSTALLLVGVVLGLRRSSATDAAKRPGAMMAVLLATALVATALIALSQAWHLQPLTDGRFNLSSYVIGWAVVLMSLVGVALIFGTRSHDRPILGWLALVLTATFADMTLSTISGARHSLGWYVSRCSTVIASYLLVAYMAAEFARDLRSRPAAARFYSHVGAVALAVCAVLLRYFMFPWAPTGLVYTTLFGAVAIAVWMGGWGPATLCAALGYVLALLVIKPPIGFIEMAWPQDWLALGLYALSCGLIIALGHNMRAARVRFQKSQEAAVQGYSILRALRAPDGKIVDFVIEYVNPRGAALAKQTPETAVGRRVTEMLPGVVSAGVFASFCNVVETGHPLESEVRYEQDGVVGWFRNMVVKVDDGVAISYFDITHAKRLERELAQRATQLERADSNKSQFLATLSHELRNPLAPLRNGLAILRRRGAPEQADMLSMMDRQLGQLVRLVDDLLDVSRIDRGKIDLKRERVAVDSVVGAAIETARPAIDAKSHELVVRFAQKAMHVEGDPVRLAQIVSNLLINAAKFTPPQGRIELVMHAEGNDAEISVRDNGVGIEAEQLPRVFEMFVQVDSQRDHAGGLGLGLALVKSLVELHHGRVEARSAGLGQGAEFVVRLPLAQAGTDAVTTRVPGGARPGGRRVLVVDDNEDGARTLGALLAANGHDVAVFLGGSEALSAATQNPPEIAFLDLNMPGMDGFELARKLRELPTGQTIRLVAVTGMGREADIMRTRAAGFDAHLTKPADPEKLIELAAGAGADSHTVVPFPRHVGRS